ncbi:unnamed protein product [Didymodactylos carnosus]|uniref:Pentapeptide repeat-containing protein n=1 Tax=Didymodactylos carnosus TaxID=1234261 RepID=A0A8S2S3U0_9BILA|nr:unnamed protein product [Didymodactylos carnosus]CAF4200407.1 unnamed protein product [Didymodactylos carnosus]
MNHTQLSLVVQSRKTKDEERRTLICGLTRSESLKVLAALLVPLTIGIFTVVATFQENYVDKQNRLTDLEIAAQQRDHEQQQAKELQIQTAYVAYIKEMGDLLLKSDKNLSKDELKNRRIIIRAKTLSTLRQLDPQRKTHLIQFLHEAGLLHKNRKPIDLDGADLSNTNFSGSEVLGLNLNYVSLSYVTLINATFINVDLESADFSWSVLTYGSFINSYLDGANFSHCEMAYSYFNDVSVDNTIFSDVNLTGTKANSWDFPRRIINSLLSDGTYVYNSSDNGVTDTFSLSNLISNSDVNDGKKCANDTKEAKAGDHPSWRYFEKTIATVIDYDAFSSFHKNRSGDCVFWGGEFNDPDSYIYQTIDLSSYSRLIDSDKAWYEFRVSAGGIETDKDYVRVSFGIRSMSRQTLLRHELRKYNTLSSNCCFYLLPTSNSHLHRTLLGHVTNSDRENQSKLILRSSSGLLPKYSRAFSIYIKFIKVGNGSFNNGLIDDFSLIIKQVSETV